MTPKASSSFSRIGKESAAALEKVDEHPRPDADFKRLARAPETLPMRCKTRLPLRIATYPLSLHPVFHVSPEVNIHLHIIPEP